MATSFVEFRNYGFWAHDSFLEGLLYLIVKELKTLALNNEWKEKLMASWAFSYSAGFAGCIPVELDEKLDDDEKIKLILNTIKLIIGRINKDDEYLTHGELNSNLVGGKGTTWLGINKKGFLRTAHMTIDLLEGRLETNASSPLTYLEFD
jgi:hypothetical protein